MKQIPRIEKFMTAMPHSINPHLPIKTAVAMMRQYSVRHLPVQDGGQLVGVLSDRDVKLDAVVLEMAEHKFGCAVIQQQNGRVVGIFTAIDGLRTLGEILRFKPSPGGPEARR